MSEIFNQEALEALDDHSEAEEMARVASPKLRLVLAAMLMMVAVVLYWCIFGTINYKVTAQGVVFPFDEATPVTVPYDGTVTRNLVSHGTAVERGAGVVGKRPEEFFRQLRIECPDLLRRDRQVVRQQAAAGQVRRAARKRRKEDTS